ncbi:hypothetical protein CMUS01_01043 [Colletotrichum musicola]|uniref:Uncharacterized protein n=1 Tax=Colletotrichum musicola TaxID=2175873 RepID=A0A8H6U8F6_9PEZI|nr:hypothetical protein CMUS01_01043 [Colletotrichum musicola]
MHDSKASRIPAATAFNRGGNMLASCVSAMIGDNQPSMAWEGLRVYGGDPHRKPAVALRILFSHRVPCFLVTLPAPSLEPLTTQILYGLQLQLALSSHLSMLAASAGIKRDQSLGENASPCQPQTGCLTAVASSCNPPTINAPNERAQLFVLFTLYICAASESVQPLSSRFT